MCEHHCEEFRPRIEGNREKIMKDFESRSFLRVLPQKEQCVSGVQDELGENESNVSE